MDSVLTDTVKVVIDTGVAIIDYLFPQFLAVVVFPLVELLKKTKVPEYIPLEIIAFALSAVGMFLLGTFFAPEVDMIALLRKASEALGTSTVMFGIYRWKAKTAAAKTISAPQEKP